MRIAILSSEVVPFAKTGGLADVAGALPKALGKHDVDARVILPLYQQIDLYGANKRLNWKARSDEAIKVYDMSIK